MMVPVPWLLRLMLSWIAPKSHSPWALHDVLQASVLLAVMQAKINPSHWFLQVCA